MEYFYLLSSSIRMEASIHSLHLCPSQKEICAVVEQRGDGGRDGKGWSDVMDGVGV